MRQACGPTWLPDREGDIDVTVERNYSRIESAHLPRENAIAARDKSLAAQSREWP